MNTSLNLEKLATAFEPLREDRARPYLGRSLYDVSIASVIEALASGDEALPFLTANSLRHQLAGHAGSIATQWKVCYEFTQAACEDAAADPEAFAETVVNATRNTPKYDESRKHAKGMVFHGGNDAYGCTNGGYGLLWAFEKHSYYGIDTSNAYVANFGVKNLYGVNIRGERGAECVHPALVPNSAIERVVVHYDMTPSQRGYSFVTRNVVFEPANTPSKILIKEHSSLKADIDVGNTLKDARSTDFETVGSISLGSEGVISIDSSDYYQEIIGKMIEHLGQSAS